jgi:hypothetical protein
MRTSNFSNAGSDPDAVAISQGVPKGYTGRRYMPLAPPWSLVREKDEDVYRAAYLKQLSRLDPQKVYDDLGENAILLCWEKPGEFCHRRLVAQWLESELGVTIPEIVKDQSLTLAFDE